jgi:hypothetical protein
LKIYKLKRQIFPLIKFITESMTDAQTSMQLSRGFQTGFGSNFDANAGYTGAGGYIYQPIGSASITIPANHGYTQTTNFHQAAHAHNNYVQPQYPLNHQISALNNGLINGTGKVKSIANSHSSALYIKTEPMTANNRRQRSQSPPRTSLVSKQALKRTPSRRKSIKNDVNTSLNESKSDEGNNPAVSTAIPTISSSSGLNTGSSSTTEATPASPKLASTSESNNNQPLTPAPNRGGRGKKGHHELLTEAEKKANHIASEQKRRQNIRLGFDQLVEIVPTLSQCHQKCN